MVGERQEAVAAMQCLEDGSLGRIDHLAIADGLEAEVDLVVFAHTFDPGPQTFTDAYLLKDLVMIEEAGMLLVDDDLVTEVRLLPNECFDFLTFLVGRRNVAQMLVNLACADNAARQLVYIYK